MTQNFFIRKTKNMNAWITGCSDSSLSALVKRYVSLRCGSYKCFVFVLMVVEIVGIYELHPVLIPLINEYNTYAIQTSICVFTESVTAPIRGWQSN